ncbi:hypothetical protein DOK78_001937 [Enterococcus sp. DIV2402]|uniref:HTH araC/xylS-type domain-containing protein n=1 Tax=Candidatus Enterococcus lowellii TaxID=2230877 RepID=A0ABZ2STS1_9ENTE|nr:AraC family transcriptional regulator [Enterococcus sp. DIV2402]MBO0463932.1 helix-turn-helix domain-containing protein [Enterococcus sp. DIV2402]
MTILYEKNQYNDPRFPFEIYQTDMTGTIPQGRGFNDLHWHEELQFTLIKKGKISIQINGEDLILQENEGIFINSGVLHQMIEMETNSKYHSINFPKELLGFSPNSRLEINYVNPYTEKLVLPYLTLHLDSSWQNRILANLLEIEEIYLTIQERDFAWQYQISILLVESWLILIRAIKEIPNKEISTKSYLHYERMQIMLQFIHEHYFEDTSLNDIAEITNISISECTRTFKKFTHTTPYNYLINYRIKRSLDLLLKEDSSISEIALKVGFNQSSHFIKAFKKQFGYPPKQYKDFY